ncbi:MAG: vWA domain-containing protein [Gallionella sp.]
MKRSLPVSLMLFGALFVSACGDSRVHSQAVYMLVDTSGSYARQVNKAAKVVNYLLATLNPGDSLAVAKVETRSFTEKDIVAKVTFDKRPSQSIEQKRAFKVKIDSFARDVHGSAYTDITGALIQGAEYLNETKAGNKTIVIFSDMQEELNKGTVRDFPIDLKGIRIVALNVSKLGTDNADPRLYLDRLARWEARVRKAGATNWVVVNDLENNMDSILNSR